MQIYSASTSYNDAKVMQSLLSTLLYLPLKRTELKVHEVQENLKGNLVNNESRDKSKCFP